MCDHERCPMYELAVKAANGVGEHVDGSENDADIRFIRDVVNFPNVIERFSSDCDANPGDNCPLMGLASEAMLQKVDLTKLQIPGGQ